MTKDNYNTTKRCFSHLSDTQRGELEILAKEGTYTQRQMAKELGVDQSTISRELKRGKTQQMNSDRTYYNVYLADAGSRVYQNHAQRNTLNILVPFLKSSLKQLLRRMTSHESIVSTHSFTHIVERILMNVYRVQKLFIR